MLNISLLIMQNGLHLVRLKNKLWDFLHVLKVSGFFFFFFWTKIKMMMLYLQAFSN